MKEINIGLAGFGTVGQALYKVIEQARNVHARIAKICVRSLTKPREIRVPESLLTISFTEITRNPDIDLVVEVIDDPETSFRLVSDALRNGGAVDQHDHHHYQAEENQEAHPLPLPGKPDVRQTGKALLYDASSCGSIPVIRNLEEYYDNDLLLEVKGILNGSSNYILSRVFDHNEDYADALERAQKLGFAESDPSHDISGNDSLNKLVIITLHAIGVYVAPADVFVYGIPTLGQEDILYAREKGMKIKLVAQVVKLSDDLFTMFVMPEFVAPNRYIYAVDDEYNGVVIRGECYDRQFMFGKGAGGLPTASSLLSDITALRHDYRYEYKKTAFAPRPEYTTDIPLKIYARFSQTNLLDGLPWLAVSEEYRSESFRYVVGEILLADLIKSRKLLEAEDVFLCNFPRFFTERDD